MHRERDFLKIALKITGSLFVEFVGLSYFCGIYKYV